MKLSEVVCSCSYLLSLEQLHRCWTLCDICVPAARAEITCRGLLGHCEGCECSLLGQGEGRVLLLLGSPGCDVLHLFVSLSCKMMRMSGLVAFTDRIPSQVKASWISYHRLHLGVVSVGGSCIEARQDILSIACFFWRYLPL